MSSGCFWERFRFFSLKILQRLILLSAPPLLASECNVTYAVQLKRNVGAVQSKATKLVVLRFRLDPGHAPRPKGFIRPGIWSWSPRTLLCAAFSWFQMVEAERPALSGRCGCARVDREVARHGHNGFFAHRAGGGRAFAQKAEPFRHRRILRLEARHAPGALHQGGAHPRVASFGYASRARVCFRCCARPDRARCRN